jgi:hypothetical protein
VNPSEAAALLAAMKPDGTFPDVPYDDTGPGNWRAASHLSHVLTLARWYSSLGPDAPEKTRARDAYSAASISGTIRITAIPTGGGTSSAYPARALADLHPYG